jgi:hypothetical protein
MERTIAQALIDEGEETGIKLGSVIAKQDDLILILCERFEVSQGDISESIRSINQVDELDKLIKRAVTAKTLKDVGIENKAR